MSKKEKKAAKAEASKKEQEKNREITEKASKDATIKKTSPILPSPEEKIVAENIEKGDEATLALKKIQDNIENGRTCPKCGEINPKGKVTCKCGEKLYSKKTDAIKDKKKTIQGKVTAEKKEAKIRYSRKDSIADAIKELGTFTEEELISKADSLFNKNGGASNLKESKFCVSYVLAPLARLEVLTVADGKYTFKK